MKQNTNFPLRLPDYNIIIFAIPSLYRGTGIQFALITISNFWNQSLNNKAAPKASYKSTTKNPTQKLSPHG